jgi:hypothetical protein
MADRREPPSHLAERESRIANAELELAIAEAQVRTREAMVEAQRLVLVERARGLDARERQVREAPVVGALAELEADVQVEHLQQGRRALAKAREDWLERRRQLLDARRIEIEAVEQGLARAQLRLDGRERRLHESIATVAPRPVSNPAVKAAKASTFHGIGAPTAPESAPRVLTRPLGTEAVDEVRTSRNLHSPSMRPATTTSRPAPPSVPIAPDDPRHATTQTMQPEDGETMDRPVRPRPVGPPRKLSRSTIAPVLAPPQAGLPDDLPDAMPARSPRPSQMTTPFVPGLTLDGEPVVRAQLQLDRGGDLLLVSFRRGAPALESTPVLTFQAAGGAGLRFQAELRRIVPAPEGGAVAVLSTQAWDTGRREAFERALALLP